MRAPRTLAALSAVGAFATTATGCGEQPTRAGGPDARAADEARADAIVRRDELEREDPGEARTALIACLDEQGLEAWAEGSDQVRVGASRAAPRVVIAANSGVAQAMAVRGEAMGAEQIGSTLLFVGDGSEAELTRVEGCLEEL